MKLYFILILLVAIHFEGIAQQDTSVYQLQREKVNLLLDQRSAKFGQYDESLSKRTGIFGLKSKRDMQRSNDILTEIVRTDNEIFRELKVLLDYKDFEKTEAQSKAGETENRVVNFMSTINKLQDQNENLKSELRSAESTNYLLVVLLIVFMLIVLISGIKLYRKKKLTLN